MVIPNTFVGVIPALDNPKHRLHIRGDNRASICWVCCPAAGLSCASWKSKGRQLRSCLKL